MVAGVLASPMGAYMLSTRLPNARVVNRSEVPTVVAASLARLPVEPLIAFPGQRRAAEEGRRSPYAIPNAARGRLISS